MRTDRDILRVTAARFVSRAGGEAAFFVGVWGKAAYEFRSTPGQLAVLMFVMALASIAGSIVSGVLVDRYGPRRVLLGAEIVFVPVALSMMLAGSMMQLAALAGLLGLVTAPVMTAAASFAPFLTEDPDQLRRANAWIEGAGSASFVVGPAVGAVLAKWAGIDSIFIFDAVTSVIGAALVAGMRLRHTRRRRGESHPFAEFREGLRGTYRLRGLRYHVLAGTLVWLGFGAFGALEPLFYRDVVGAGVEMIGYANTVFGAGLVLGAALMPRLPEAIVSAKGLAVACAATGLGSVLYVGSSDIRRVMIGALVWGGIIGVLDPLLRTLIHRDSPEELVGRIAGTSMVHRHAGELLPLAFAPALASAFGVQPTLIGGGVTVAVIAVASLPEAFAIDRATRRRPGPRPGPETYPASEEPVSPNP